MRSSNTSNLFSPFVLTLCLASCGSPTSAVDAGGDSHIDGGSPSSCQIEATGNTPDRAQTSACAEINAPATVDGGGAGVSLDINARTTKLLQLTATIDLGSAPAIGRLSAESGMSWNAIGFASATNCVFVADSAGGPTGSFALTLSFLDVSKKLAHGMLALTMYVHAPQGADCGYGDTEKISIKF